MCGIFLYFNFGCDNFETNESSRLPHEIFRLLLRNYFSVNNNDSGSGDQAS